jgi:predicted MPP superfamily phosphohydrolase
MSLFLVTFFLIYGGVHLYFFMKVKIAFGIGMATVICLALLLVMLVLAPVLVRMLEKEGLETTARTVAYTGYLWMGFLFLFFTSSLALDVYSVMVRAAGIIFRKDNSPLQLSNRMAFLIPFAWGMVTAVYGYYEARNIRVERVRLTSPKIPTGAGKLTIVQISDVHLGLIVRRERLSMMLDKIKAAAPDILVSTGDLVDGQINGLSGLAKLFRDVNPPFGKYAITGNHELYAGLEHSVDFMQGAGFRVLRGEAVTIPGIMCIAGVDDPAVSRVGGSATDEEQHLAARLPRDSYTVLLKHRPVVARESLGLVDLQLSGHVHKGQLFPFNLVTYLFYPVQAGLNRLPRHTGLYVSRGTGTWGPPIRFLAPPEITVIELTHGPGL